MYNKRRRLRRREWMNSFAHLIAAQPSLEYLVSAETLGQYIPLLWAPSMRRRRMRSGGAFFERGHIGKWRRRHRRRAVT
jgi:hypothetical protein